MDELYHQGIKGMKWGRRRFRNYDNSLTAAGKKRYVYNYDHHASDDGPRRKSHARASPESKMSTPKAVSSLTRRERAKVKRAARIAKQKSWDARVKAKKKAKKQEKREEIQRKFNLRKRAMEFKEKLLASKGGQPVGELKALMKTPEGERIVKATLKSLAGLAIVGGVVYATARGAKPTAKALGAGAKVAGKVGGKALKAGGKAAITGGRIGGKAAIKGLGKLSKAGFKLSGKLASTAIDDLKRRR